MCQHAWVEGRPGFCSGSVFAIIPASIFLQKIDGKFLVELTEPFGARGVVGKIEPQEKSAQHDDDALYDEEPPKAF